MEYTWHDPIGSCESAESYGWDPGPGGLGDRVKNRREKAEIEGEGSCHVEEADV